jgi:hypothetical protein
MRADDLNEFTGTLCSSYSHAVYIDLKQVNHIDIIG